MQPTEHDEFIPFFTHAPEYRTEADPVLHSCGTGECETPEWWQEHCTTYDLVVSIGVQRAQLTEQLTAHAGPVVNSIMAANPQLTNRQMTVALDKAITAWIGRVATDNHEPFTAFITKRTVEALPKFTVSPAPLETKAHKCRHKVPCTLPDGFELHCSVYQDICALHRNEEILVHYLMPRVRENIRSNRLHHLVIDHEKELVESMMSEALIRCLREYDHVNTTIPLQKYLRHRMPQRWQDVLSTLRPMSRNRRDYLIATSREMKTNMRIETRAQAAAQLGLSVEHTNDMERLIELDRMYSLEGSTHPSDEKDVYERALQSLYDGVNLEEKLLEEIITQALEGLSAKDRGAMLAHSRGELDEWLKRHDIKGSRCKADWYRRAGTLLQNLEDLITEARDRANVFNARAWLRSRSREQIREMNIAGRSGKLSQWAEREGLTARQGLAVAHMSQVMMAEARQLDERIAVVAKTNPTGLSAWAEERGLDRLWVLSRARTLLQGAR